MVDFTLFRLRDELGDFDAYVESGDDRHISAVGPVDVGDFAAKLYFADTWRQTPPWLSFVSQVFPGAILWQPSRSISALVVVNANPNGTGRYFAFAFGPAGRHILRSNAYFRRYGLITALNLIADSEAPPQLRAFDTTRHGQGILRSRLQTASASTIEVFELDVLRDLIRHATGQPADIEQWGRRVGGSDALRLAADIPFTELGAFCLMVDEVARAETYRERFEWIDNIQPVIERPLLGELESEVINLLRGDRTDLVQLAPPEVVDWDVLSGFQYHFDTRRRPLMTRSDVSLPAYLAGLRAVDPDLEEITADRLRGRRLLGLNEDGERYREWPIWQCLVAEFEYQGATYVLEDGAFYRVGSRYLEQLNEHVLRFRQDSDLLPPARPGATEPEYNREAAAGSDRFLLLDADEVPAEGARGGIELCDLLTDQRQFVHVKRYGSSKQLSHLFAQSRVAAELLLVNADFRTAAQALIRARSNGSARFDVIDPDAMRPGECEVVLGIIKGWAGRDIDTLPFFAKVDLRRTLIDLTSRGYAASVLRIPVEQ